MTSDIKRLEHSIQAAKKNLDLGNALERLLNNRDFKQVIKSGYFEQEAIRLVHLKSDPQMDSPVRQASIIRDMDSIGALSSYLSEIRRQADLARRSIESDEAMLEELRNEEV